MAKAYGPLHSDSASGKFANSLVFFGWKGINVIRRYVIPANPQTAGQGDSRQILGGLGRAAHAAQAGSAYLTDAKLVSGPSETYVSALVKAIIDAFMKDGTEFDSVFTTYNAHSAKSTFISAAATQGLTDLSITYRGATAVFTAGMQMYCLGLYGILKRNPISGAFNRSPFDTAMASWTSTEVTELLADLQP